MRKSIVLNNLNDPTELKSLRDYLIELYEETDVVYTTIAPNSNITARRGKFALYNNSGTYTVWINIDGSTLWQQV